MGQGLGILSVLGWIDYFFPSLTVYTNILGPIVVVLLGGMSIFSDMLPKPGDVFLVPDLEDLEIELYDASIFVKIFSKIARNITRSVNRVLSTKVYRWFYSTSKRGSSVISYLMMSKTKRNIIEIHTPEPFNSSLDKDHPPHDED